MGQAAGGGFAEGLGGVHRKLGDERLPDRSGCAGDCDGLDFLSDRLGILERKETSSLSVHFTKMMDTEISTRLRRCRWGSWNGTRERRKLERR